LCVPLRCSRLGAGGSQAHSQLCYIMVNSHELQASR
jgi:hypothetical protein